MSTRRTASPSEAEDIGTLKQRHDLLQKEKTRAETKLESAEKELERLKREAREAYGTDDLSALQAQLETRKQDNERKRAAYQSSLDKIERDLHEVESRYDDSRRDQPG